MLFLKAPRGYSKHMSHGVLHGLVPTFLSRFFSCHTQPSSPLYSPPNHVFFLAVTSTVTCFLWFSCWECPPYPGSHAFQKLLWWTFILSHTSEPHAAQGNNHEHLTIEEICIQILVLIFNSHVTLGYSCLPRKPCSLPGPMQKVPPWGQCPPCSRKESINPLSLVPLLMTPLQHLHPETNMCWSLKALRAKNGSHSSLCPLCLFLYKVVLNRCLWNEWYHLTVHPV